MKILFYNLAPINEVSKLPASSVSDYQLDLLYHGLVSLGEEVYEEPYMWWTRSFERREESKDIWGLSYSAYHLLENEWKQANQSDKFDLTIIGLHWTMTKQDAYLEHVVDKALERPEQFGKVIVIDGWDQDYIYRPVAQKVKYFKRELTLEYEDIALPISFAFPEEKIISREQGKNKTYERAFSRLIPVNQSINPDYMKTYIYKTEEAYYRQYQQSLFGFTSKKGGWDTLRHYEIIANGCVPLFIGLEDCPEKTLFRFPKDLCKQALRLPGLLPPLKQGKKWPDNYKNCSFLEIGEEGSIDKTFRWDWYNDLRSQFLNWLRIEGTTKALASYVLEEAFSGT